jgi:hypothetical protein
MRTPFNLLLALFLTNSFSSDAQCNSEELKKQCVPQLASGFNFIKSYKIDGVSGAREKIEYSYVFCKGTQYLINICTADNSTNGIVVSLYDSKRNKVASSKIDDKSVSRLAYHCSSSGIYYIQYTFDGSSTYCGGSALAFKRN